MDGLARSGRVGMSFSLNDSNQVKMCLAGACQVRENTATCSMPWLAGVRELILRSPVAAGHLIPILVGQIMV
jgi:hypothetical protein